jgi:hypothetical protein
LQKQQEQLQQIMKVGQEEWGNGDGGDRGNGDDQSINGTVAGATGAATAMALGQKQWQWGNDRSCFYYSAKR